MFWKEVTYFLIRLVKHLLNISRLTSPSPLTYDLSDPQSHYSHQTHFCPFPMRHGVLIYNKLTCLRKQRLVPNLTEYRCVCWAVVAFLV